MSFLKSAFRDIKEESKINWLFAAIIFLFISIPLRYAYSSTALIFFFICSFQHIRTIKYGGGNLLFKLPIFIFILMALSILWSIDTEKSTNALSKNLPLILLPIGLIINPVNARQRQKLIKYYSIIMVVYAIYYIIRAVFRYFNSHNTIVFFYHELVEKDVNAIHVSLYFSIALFYFFKNSAKPFHSLCLLLLALCIFLLSSKNIIIMVFLIMAIHYLFFSKIVFRARMLIIGAVFAGIIVSVLSFPQIRERFLIEVNTATTENTVNNEISTTDGRVYNISVLEAWNNSKFQYNHYFPGIAFRVYQFRIFLELLSEENTYLTGYGLNATESKIQQKASQYNINPSYGNFNFHNQYIQYFAEVGFAGFILLLVILACNIKNAIRSKDFIHIAFAILTISLFLTESFLSRQRGIIFFVLFYCLLNADYDKNDNIKMI